jgi:hypothetical protein
MPTATDLVTDLPADFEVFGQAVDTDLADLNGGTTGQLLSKTSNTDLDFTWVTPNAGDITGVTAGTGISGGGTSGDVTVTNSMATAIDAKGDLVAGTGADAFSRLGVGANNTVLTADSAEATGLKWATVSSEKARIVLKNTGQYLRRRTTTSFDNFDAIVNRLYLTPMYLSGNSFDRISFRTGSGTYSGTGVYRLGLYNVDLTTGRPNTVYLDAGTVNATANSTNYEITISTTPPAGYYYLALVEQTAPAGGGNVAAITLTDSNDGIALGTYPSIDSAAASYNTFYYEAGVSSALPTTSSLTIATGAIPMVLLRMA